MVKVLFVCHGNICRSPMAEFVMKDLVKKAKLEHKFHIASAAVSREELGNPVGNWRATAFPAMAMRHIRSRSANMTNMTISTTWIPATAAICSGC